MSFASPALGSIGDFPGRDNEFVINYGEVGRGTRLRKWVPEVFAESWRGEVTKEILDKP